MCFAPMEILLGALALVGLVTLIWQAGAWFDRNTGSRWSRWDHPHARYILAGNPPPSTKHDAAQEASHAG